MDAGQPQQVAGYPETSQATLTWAIIQGVCGYMETSLKGDKQDFCVPNFTYIAFKV